MALFIVTCFTQISLPFVCLKRLTENPEMNRKTFVDLPRLAINMLWR